MLVLLATDGRMSLQSLSEMIGTPKSTTHLLYWKLVSANGLVFIPEINIGELHKFEILDTAKRRTKRELMKAVMEEDIIAASYGEYIVHFSFMNMPAAEELVEILQSSHLTQYAGLTENGVVAYCVAKYADELDLFISKSCKAFDSYGITPHLYSIRKQFGFFPLRDEFIKNTELPERYKRLLIGMRDGGQYGFRSVEYAALIERKILRRITCYKTSSEGTISLFVRLRADDYIGKYSDRILGMVRSEVMSGINPFAFVCSSTNANEIFIFANLENEKAAKLFALNLESEFEGVEVICSVLKGIVGNLGVREIELDSENSMTQSMDNFLNL